VSGRGCAAKRARTMDNMGVTMDNMGVSGLTREQLAAF
jgi:hypothetical protein